MSDQIAIAVIGGSGLYHMPGLSDVQHLEVNTPFGPPSGEIVVGSVRGKRVAFLPRHGVGHIYTPSTVPYRANIWALRSLGVRFILAVNACGSLRQDYAPGHVVIPDQLIDYTKADRGRSFFDTSIVGHVSVADPLCAELNAIADSAIERAGGIVHRGGAFVTIEGPRFSTRAESHMFRSFGCCIVGMTTCPEAFLAREAEIAYTAMSHVTDYDSWHVSEAPVTVEQVMAVLHHNLALAQQAIAETVAEIDEHADWPAHHSLDSAIVTDPKRVPPALIERLRPILGRLYTS